MKTALSILRILLIFCGIFFVISLLSLILLHFNKLPNLDFLPSVLIAPAYHIGTILAYIPFDFFHYFWSGSYGLRLIKYMVYAHNYNPNILFAVIEYSNLFILLLLIYIPLHWYKKHLLGIKNIVKINS